MEKNMSEVILVENLVDLNYRGLQYNEADSQKYPFRLTGVEAVKNVIKLYLMSQKGDYGRDIYSGGILINTLAKLMDLSNSLKIEQDIRTALSRYSNIVVSTVVVEKIESERKWKISIHFMDTYNKFVDTINLVVSP
jgi:hypothetical protein